MSIISQNMKIAVVGYTSYIAKYLLERFKTANDIDKVVKIGRNNEADLQLDLEHPEKFDYSMLRDIDYIVFLAAVSGPDKCAIEYETCWNINVTGTKFFIEKAVEVGCKILFFSSDAVFGDVPGKIYTEESETKAMTPYGRMKKAIEDSFANCSFFKAIRLPYVVSAKDKFVSYCINCMRKREVAEVYHPLYRNCVTVCDVVDVVIWLIHNWNGFTHMFLNVAGRELISRVRIADEINCCMGGILQYNIVTPDVHFYDNRPRITQMQSKYLQTYKIIKEMSFTEKMQAELKGVEI